MARSRKTIDVEHIKQWTNERLAQDHYSDMEKYGMMNMLDHILNETGNYKGYDYLDKYDANDWTMKKDLRRKYI